MSHWHKGKISLNCSLEVLRKALINIMPEWESHIKVDPSKQLSATSKYQESLSGYSIVIRQGEDTGVYGADIGFKQEKDGSWSVSFDYLPEKWRGETIGGLVTLEVSKMRARAVVEYFGLEICRDEDKDNEHIIEVIVPLAFRNKKKGIKQ